MTEVKSKWMVSDAIEALKSVTNETIDLVITSPPYNVGKEYESKLSEEEYINFIKVLISELTRVCKQTASICWQVGNCISHTGEELPLDIITCPLFRDAGWKLRNRIIWKVPYGLNATKKLSGRYETLLWFTKSNQYTFNLDEARIPSDYPGKTNIKTGSISGNPLGKNPSNVWDLILTEMDLGIIEICNVKNGHPEKTLHPAQYPLELAERCVLLFSNPGDIILDPFSGSGTTSLACDFHERRCISIEKEPEYFKIYEERKHKLDTGCLPFKEIGELAKRYNDKRSELNDKQLSTWRTMLRKRRIVETPFHRDKRLKSDDSQM